MKTMRRHRILTAIGVGTSGLILVATLTGAASASAATTTEQQPAKPGATVSVPSAPSTPVAKPVSNPVSAPVSNPVVKPVSQPAPANRRAGTGDRAGSSARTVARVKAAVLAKYPRVTINSVTARDDGGWTVTVTTRKGVTGTVSVDRSLSVGTLVLHHAARRG
jgi:hypothetical protein